MKKLLAPYHSWFCAPATGLVFTLLILAACKAPAPQPAIPTSTHTRSVPVETVPYPAPDPWDYTKWPTQEPYPAPLEAAQPPTPFPTPTSSPTPTTMPPHDYAWTVPAVDVSNEPHPDWYRSDLKSTDSFTSPSGKYWFRCRRGAFNIYEMPEERLVASARYPAGKRPECTYTNWRPDEGAVIFGSTIGDYYWQYRAALPNPLQSLVPEGSRVEAVDWSPDSKQLAALVYGPFRQDERASTFVYIWDLGKQQFDQKQFELPSCWATGIQWELANFIEIGDDCYTRNYVDLRSGQVIWRKIHPGMAAMPILPQQELMISPDQRWLAFGETSNYKTNAAGNLYFIRQFDVYDAQTQTFQRLALGSDFRITFSGWTPDSSRLYWFSTPSWQGRKAYGLPGEKFGLTVYNPLTRQASVVLEDVIQTEWNSDMTRAWVLIRRSLSSGVEQTVSGIWTPGDKQVTSERIVYETIPEPWWPNTESEIAYYPPQLAALWSHNGQRVVFSSYDGLLILEDIQGNQKILTERLRSSDYDLWMVHLAWSPDDTVILVWDNGRTTLLTIPPDLSTLPQP